MEVKGGRKLLHTRGITQKQNRLRVNNFLGKEKHFFLEIFVWMVGTVIPYLASFFTVPLGITRTFYFISLCCQREDLNFFLGEIAIGYITGYVFAILT